VSGKKPGIDNYLEKEFKKIKIKIKRKPRKRPLTWINLDNYNLIKMIWKKK